MKAQLHPKYEVINVTCSCGNQFETKSTYVEKSSNLHLDVCSKCHPFYTGTQKIVDTAGRVDLFNKKFAMFGTGAAANSDKSDKK